jgi:hypothetical protein
LCYQRKYFDRNADDVRNAITESIKGLLGSGEITVADRGISVTNIGRATAKYDFRLTEQRITFSYYRVDDVAFVVPFDMKRSQDPAPQALLFSKAIAPAPFEFYLTEFVTAFGEANSVLK